MDLEQENIKDIVFNTSPNYLSHDFQCPITMKRFHAGADDPDPERGEGRGGGERGGGEGRGGGGEFGQVRSVETPNLK